MKTRLINSIWYVPDRTSHFARSSPSACSVFRACGQTCCLVFFSAFVCVLISFFGPHAFLCICVAGGRGGGRLKFPFYTIVWFFVILFLFLLCEKGITVRHLSRWHCAWPTVQEGGGKAQREGALQPWSAIFWKYGRHLGKVSPRESVTEAPVSQEKALWQVALRIRELGCLGKTNWGTIWQETCAGPAS